MDIAQEIATYLGFQTQKMKGVKELVTVDTLVAGQLFPIF